MISSTARRPFFFVWFLLYFALFCFIIFFLCLSIFNQFQMVLVNQARAKIVSNIEVGLAFSWNDTRLESNQAKIASRCRISGGGSTHSIEL